MGSGGRWLEIASSNGEQCHQYHTVTSAQGRPWMQRGYTNARGHVIRVSVFLSGDNAPRSACDLVMLVSRTTLFLKLFTERRRVPAAQNCGGLIEREGRLRGRGARRRTWFDEQTSTLHQGLNPRAVSRGRIWVRIVLNNMSGHS